MQNKLFRGDRKYLGRDNPPWPVEISGAKGSYLFGSNGKKYIDFLMGWCVGNVGWGQREIRSVIRNFDGPDYVNPNYLYKPWVELAKILSEMTPGNLTRSFRATGGTEAVEIALQTAMMHTKRAKFISIEGSYHGHSIGAMSVGSSDFRGWYRNLMPGCYKIKPPLDERSAKQIVSILKKREVAGLIMEPVICNLGVVIPTKEYFKIISAACKKYGTLLIIDEVATGFGRTGKMFGAEHYKLKPDIMCLAKAISGGYGGIGATVTTPAIAKSMEFDFSFYSTYGWNPINIAGAIANIKYLKKHRITLQKNTKIMGQYFEDRLKAMKFKYPAEIRVKGLAIGVEFKRKGYTGNIVKRCRDKGVLFSDLGPMIFTLFPALNIDRKTAKEGLDVIESCL